MRQKSFFDCILHFFILSCSPFMMMLKCFRLEIKSGGDKLMIIKVDVEEMENSAGVSQKHENSTFLSSPIVCASECEHKNNWQTFFIHKIFCSLPRAHTHTHETENGNKISKAIKIISCFSLSLAIILHH
jgi:hypothetical protein